MGDKSGEATVRLEIEFGDIEVEFEGPADFARADLVPLLGALLDKLASVEVGFEDEDEDDEDEAETPAPAEPARN